LISSSSCTCEAVEGDLIIRRRRCEKYEIDIGAGKTSHVECLSAGLNRQTCSGAAVATFANTGAFANPLIGRIEASLEVGIGDDDVRKGRSPTGDGCAAWGWSGHRFLGVMLITRCATKRLADWW